MSNAGSMTDIKLARDRTVAVNTSLPWLPVDRFPPPRGVKLQLIDRSLGVAHYGQYTPGAGYSHWQGLPHFLEDEDALTPEGRKECGTEPDSEGGGA
jgi:hypothetical protein